MHHRDLVDRVWVKIRMEKGVRRIHTATKLPVSREQTAELMKSVFETVQECLADGQEVSVPGFGKFTIKKFPDGSTVFHPLTKERVPRRANRMKSIRFKASSTLLNGVNSK